MFWQLSYLGLCKHVLLYSAFEKTQWGLESKFCFQIPWDSSIIPSISIVSA